MPDALFAVPELAAVYDALDPDRRDLDVYANLLEELGSQSVLDVGCGTGTFAVLLAARGFAVTGVDPATASLDVARSKPGAEQVTWIPGDATSLPDVTVDAVTMTGNVAQVFLGDDEWQNVLLSARQVLTPGRHLVFETRNPAAQAWREWTPKASRRVAAVGVGTVASWNEVSGVTDQTVSFTTTFEFSAGPRLTSESTLRFRELDEVCASLRDAGFHGPEIREAPDRPGLEHVFIAKR